MADRRLRASIQSLRPDRGTDTAMVCSGPAGAVFSCFQPSSMAVAVADTARARKSAGFSVALPATVTGRWSRLPSGI